MTQILFLNERLQITHMNPVLIFLMLIIGLPLGEIYFLIEVGSIIGAIPTILITVMTAVIGISLIRIQGMSTVQKLQLSISLGQSPAVEILEGVMLMLAAICLLIPGFVSDSIGFLLLIPPLRQVFAKYFIQRQIFSAKQSFHANQPKANKSFIEGEYIDLSEKESIEKK